MIRIPQLYAYGGTILKSAKSKLIPKVAIDRGSNGMNRSNRDVESLVDVVNLMEKNVKNVSELVKSATGTSSSGNSEEDKDYLELVKEEIQTSENDLNNLIDAFFVNLEPVLDKIEYATAASSTSNNAASSIDNYLSSLSQMDELDPYSVILEIKAGAGGREAGLWANDLYKMYTQYCSHRNWQCETVDLTEFDDEADAIRKATLLVKDPLKLASPVSFAFSNPKITCTSSPWKRLRLESGVHCVKRVPETEKNGRMHTSTAAVVAIPQFNTQSNSNSNTLLPLHEIKIETKRAQGKGGQHVNTTDSAVKMTHIQTGITVSMQDCRSQHQNKAKALEILTARVRDIERVKQLQKIQEQRSTVFKLGIGREQRARTYRYKEQIITDDRVESCKIQGNDEFYGFLNGSNQQVFDDIGNQLAKFDLLDRLEKLPD